MSQASHTDICGDSFLGKRNCKCKAPGGTGTEVLENEPDGQDETWGQCRSSRSQVGEVAGGQKGHILLISPS